MTSNIISSTLKALGRTSPATKPTTYQRIFQSVSRRNALRTFSSKPSLHQDNTAIPPRPSQHSSAHPSSAVPPRPSQSPAAARSLHKPAKPNPNAYRSQIPPPPNPPKPEYEMTFTCTPCNTRSSHRISKQGYHHGSVLITCPECRNRHVISDHLGIFSDKSMTIEDLMKERGQLVKKGTLSEDGDVEFWEDGTSTKRARDAGGKPVDEKKRGALAGAEGVTG